MKSNFIKTISLVFLVFLSRSIYLNKEFYWRIWNNNQVTILFIGTILLFLIILIAVFNNVDEAGDNHNN